jgi:hypothetical protein
MNLEEYLEAGNSYKSLHGKSFTATKDDDGRASGVFHWQSHQRDHIYALVTGMMVGNWNGCKPYVSSSPVSYKGSWELSCSNDDEHKGFIIESTSIISEVNVEHLIKQDTVLILNQNL